MGRQFWFGMVQLKRDAVLWVGIGRGWRRRRVMGSLGLAGNRFLWPCCGMFRHGGGWR